MAEDDALYRAKGLVWSLKRLRLALSPYLVSPRVPMYPIFKLRVSCHRAASKLVTIDSWRNEWYWIKLWGGSVGYWNCIKRSIWPFFPFFSSIPGPYWTQIGSSQKSTFQVFAECEICYVAHSKSDEYNENPIDSDDLSFTEYQTEMGGPVENRYIMAMRRAKSAGTSLTNTSGFGWCT